MVVKWSSLFTALKPDNFSVNWPEGVTSYRNLRFTSNRETAIS